ncbi:phosphoglucomutase [Marinilabilia sp.]|uniref:phosphoglucomutase n=1 Tax=Marinilabilia sp. TaxID=2021252 RepID=UPI0025C077E1|nr:phosphoglucomutase [Marinilabilia sp.]
MSQTDWRKLHNGSDILGVALEGVKGEEVNFTPEIAERLGRSFVVWLQTYFSGKNKLRISVGRDPRLSGHELLASLIKGLSDEGAEVVNFGLASTPAMFMSTILGEKPVDAAVMVTGSHSPKHKNGLKLFTSTGGLDKTNITEILNLAEGDLKAGGRKGTVEDYDFMAVYSAHLADVIRKEVNHPEHFDTPLQGLKITVDAGNGSGGFFATDVLAHLGADITASQFLEPDGNFPNHFPNPEDTNAMNSLISKVKESNSDLGIIFDMDVDRSALVDYTGRPINRNSLIALASAVVLRKRPGSTIVTDSITSDGLSWFIRERLGGKHHRYQRGYKNVIDEAVRLNGIGQESCLAIETSGHAAFKDNFFLDDGAYLATRMITTLAAMRAKGKRLTDLIADLPDPVDCCEIRLRINSSDFIQTGSDIIAEVGIMAGNKSNWDLLPENYEGVRVKCSGKGQDGWFLLRLSLHDPVLPLNIESNEPGGVQKIAEELFEFFGRFDNLDLSAFKRFGL